jgi:hypothetical protein
MLRRWCIPLAGLALVGGALAASAPAAAASHPARPTIHLIRPAMHGTAPMAVRGRSANAVLSTNWSGYAATGRSTSVSATWTEPTGHCTSSSTFSSFWVGLDGFGSNSVEQTGSEVDCSGGQARYFGWYEMFPALPVNFSNPVHPGDHLTGSVTFTGSGHYTLVLKDTTQGWSHTIQKTRNAAKHASAEVIAEAPADAFSGAILPLTNFGTAHFSNAAVNGSAMGNANPTKIIMVNASGRPKDSVSALTGGTAFSVKWLHSTR